MNVEDSSASADIPVADSKSALPVTRIRNAVILPDGTKKEPLGSGVITGILGIGGMANVYEIWNPQLEVARAVKLLHPNYTEETRQRFQTEIKITAKLHHRNIIEIHAVGHWNGLPYIEMERIEGETLEKILEKRGALPIEVCTAVGIMIGRALLYAHNQDYIIYGTTYHGVIHRDLKPSNIMVSRDGVVKLMDFGIARPTDASIHTTDGAILGTMQYLSPEQLDGKNPDLRTDIYSLGTILYELLTGVKAFPEHNISKLMLSKIKNDFKSLDQFDVKVPSRLRKLTHRCMTYERDRRISDAQSFLDEMGKIHRSGSGISPEQVLKDFLFEQNAERIVVVSRSRLPLRALFAGIIIAVLSLCIWQAGRMIREQADERAATQQPSLSVPQLPAESRPAPAQTIKEQKPVVDQPVRKSGAIRSRGNIGKPVGSDSRQEPLVTPKSTIDRLREQYATDDVLTIFTGEVEKRHYREALEVSGGLTPAEAASPRASVYKMRALRGLGRLAEEKAFLAACSVADAELYLERARIAFGGNDPAGALVNLARCEQTSSAFMESGAVRLERLYLEARCVTHQFNAEHSEKLKRQALDSWYEVKLELRTAPDHRYFRDANEQMQRITGK